MKPSPRRPTNPRKPAAAQPPQAAASLQPLAEALTTEKLAGFHRHPQVINGKPTHQIVRRFYE